MRFSTVALLSVLAVSTKADTKSEDSVVETEVFKDVFGRCTALAISAGAMEDGSTIVTHGNDCPDCDFRIAHVPAADYPEGAMMPVTIVSAMSIFVVALSSCLSAVIVIDILRIATPHTKPHHSLFV
jgi:hypothetical protein